MPHAFEFLDFEHCEDGDGLRSWSALAAPAPHHLPALEAQVQALLDALAAELGEPGPLDNGHLWDMALSRGDDAGRICLSLHLSGGQALAAQLQCWGLD